MSCRDTKPGHPDIYGLGIRLSFYLLWFAIIAFSWLPIHLRGGFVALRIMHLVFSFAVFIGLAGAISSSSADSSSELLGSESTFHPDNGEVYIALLLISSGIYLLVPLYLCRVMTGCLHCCGSGCGCGRGCGASAWGQTDYLLVSNNSHRKGRGSSWDGVGGLVPLLEFIFLLLVGGLQCWFWWSGVDYPSLSDYDNCGDSSSGYGHGFLFGKIDLSDSRFRGFNSMVVLAVLIGAVVFSAIDAGICGGGGNDRNRRRKRKRRKRQTHGGLTFLRGIQTIFSLGVTVTLLVAIELSIQWNDISDGVDQVTLPAQLMPLLVTITLVLIVVLHSLTADGGYEDGGSGSSSGYGSSKSGRRGSGGSGSGSGSGSSKGSSSGSSRSGGRGDDGGVDPWNRVPNNGGGGGGQGFVPPPPFPPPPPGFAGVPPPPFPPPGAAGAAASGFPPPQVAQPFPVFPPRGNVNTVLAEPEHMEEGITQAGSSSSTITTVISPSLSGRDDIETGSVNESIADSASEDHEEGPKGRSASYRSRRPSDGSEKGDHDHDQSPSRASGERERTDQKAGFGHPPVPINMPFGRSMPLPTPGFSGVGGGGRGTEKFPPPAWPPGWSDQRESHMKAQGQQEQTPPAPPPPFYRPDGFPPAPPMPAFMPPGGVPPPPF